MGTTSSPFGRRGFLQTVGAAALGATGLGQIGSTDAMAAPPSRQSLPYPTLYPGPFAHGVASGDPLSDRVIIWTRVHDRGEARVQWEIATDAAMTRIVHTGTQLATARHDHTIKVDVTGLQPATTYYYRFSIGAQRSITGRTRTAPAGPSGQLRLAVLSCTSLWSSWWSGLGHIADRNDLDLVVHLGDYIYDFVDKDEKVRSRDGFADMTEPDNRDWLTLAECRRRYAFWRSDPNLNRAHQQHPWAMVWDNHDLDPEFGNEITVPGMANKRSATRLIDTARTFFEWTPTRPPRADGSGEFLLVEDGSYPEPGNPLLIYRHLPLGDLADLILTDSQSRLPEYGLPVDNSHLGGKPSLLGRTQFQWLNDTLAHSSAQDVRWRLVGTQTMVSPIDIPDVRTPGDLPKLGISRWSDYPAERERVTDHLRRGGPGGSRIRRNIVLSGDTHCNVGSDLIGSAALTSRYGSGPIGHNPRPGAQPGNPAAGACRVGLGSDRDLSVAVEFAPTSMGRGGADDQIAGALGVSGAPSAQAAAASLAAADAIVAANRNLQFLDWTEHGYGLIDLTHQRAVFEFWWQNKFVADSPDVLGFQMVTWADQDPAAPRHQPDQINDVRLFGMAVRPTRGRPSPPAPAAPYRS